jgi:molybdopterin-guanine dinucleotide biosynthesis protein A
VSRIAAAILAGGHGARLGGADKARLLFAGRRLIDHAIGAAATADLILVMRGANPALPGLPANAICLPDLSSATGGPLAGFAAAVAHLLVAESPPEFLLTLAVDAPFHPENFTAAAEEKLRQGQGAAIACYGGQPYPTNGLWRLAMLADLPRRVLAGAAPRSLMALAGELDALHLDWPEAAGGNPFDNVNTLADLLALQRRAKRNFGLGKAEQTR